MDDYILLLICFFSMLIVIGVVGLLCLMIVFAGRKPGSNERKPESNRPAPRTNEKNVRAKMNGPSNTGSKEIGQLLLIIIVFAVLKPIVSFLLQHLVLVIIVGTAILFFYGMFVAPLQMLEKGDTEASKIITTQNTWRAMGKNPYTYRDE